MDTPPFVLAYNRKIQTVPEKLRSDAFFQQEITYFYGNIDDAQIHTLTPWWKGIAHARH